MRFKSRCSKVVWATEGPDRYLVSKRYNMNVDAKLTKGEFGQPEDALGRPKIGKIAESMSLNNSEIRVTKKTSKHMKHHSKYDFKLVITITKHSLSYSQNALEVYQCDVGGSRKSGPAFKASKGHHFVM